MAQIIGNPWGEGLVGTSFADLIDALAGNDIVNANGGNDTVFGGEGSDTLRGGFGNDVLIGNTGNDRMNGDAGDDFMGWANGDGSDVMNGDAGYDTVGVTGSDAAGDHFTIAANGARVDFDRVNLVPFSLDIGTTEALTVNGLGGNDTITGNAGLAGLIELALSGGDGNDQIVGGDGDDLLNGDAGQDILVGFRGNDTMNGGAGSDRMIWNNGDGSDRMEGGQGYDTAVVNGSDTAADSFTIRGVGARVDFDRVNLVPFSLDIGTTEVLEVNGGLGNDSIVGGNGLDGKIKLELNGGAGWDFLKGGDGDDQMTGGAGSDTFVFGRGQDTITDFQNGQDKIQFDGFPWLNNVGDLAGRVYDTGADVVIDLGTHELTIENVNPGIFDPSDFIF